MRVRPAVGSCLDCNNFLNPARPQRLCNHKDTRYRYSYMRKERVHPPRAPRPPLLPRSPSTAPQSKCSKCSAQSARPPRRAQSAHRRRTAPQQRPQTARGAKRRTPRLCPVLLSPALARLRDSGLTPGGPPLPLEYSSIPNSERKKENTQVVCVQPHTSISRDERRPTAYSMTPNGSTVPPKRSSPVPLTHWPLVACRELG